MVVIILSDYLCICNKLGSAQKYTMGQKTIKNHIWVYTFKQFYKMFSNLSHPMEDKTNYRQIIRIFRLFGDFKTFLTTLWNINRRSPPLVLSGVGFDVDNNQWWVTTAAQHKWANWQKPARNWTKKSVKLTDHTYAYNSFDKFWIFSIEHAKTGNGNYLNRLKAWKKFVKSHQVYLFSAGFSNLKHCEAPRKSDFRMTYLSACNSSVFFSKKFVKSRRAMRCSGIDCNCENPFPFDCEKVSIVTAA